MSTHEVTSLPLTLGRQFQLARERTGLDQTQLGERFGVNRTTISRWERDKAIPPFNIVAQLSEMSDWPLEYFARSQTPIQPDPGPEGTRDLGIARDRWRVQSNGRLVLVGAGGGSDDAADVLPLRKIA